MSTGTFGGLVLRFAIVSGIAISLMQCSKPEVVNQEAAKPRASDNTFPCKTPRDVHIKTQINAPGVSPEFVVLCNTDSVTWDKDPGTHVAHFTVTFTSESPINGDNGKPKLTFSDNSNDSKGTAEDADVSQQGQYAYYEYHIDVVGDDAKHTHHPYDPGVIIVK